MIIYINKQFFKKHWFPIGFIALCIISWFCVQTGGHYDFIDHRDNLDKKAHKKMFDEIKDKIEILSYQIESVPELIKLKEINEKN